MTNQISKSTAENLTPMAINESDLRDISAERKEEIADCILEELYKPLYVFSGCLGSDGSFHRYTKTIEERR